MTKQHYIEFLIATPGNYTCTYLADHLEGEEATSHDAITDCLRREKLTPRGLKNCTEEPSNSSAPNNANAAKPVPNAII